MDLSLSEGLTLCEMKGNHKGFYFFLKKRKGGSFKVEVISVF